LLKEDAWRGPGTPGLRVPFSAFDRCESEVGESDPGAGEGTHATESL